MHCLKILIVDDSKTIRDLLKQQLEEHNYIVKAVEDAAAAINILDADGWDVMISDLNMPGSMDGLQLLAYAKDHYSDLVVIMMTGNASIETAIKSIKIGACDYFTKPFKLHDILNTLRKVYREKELSVTLKAVELHKEQGFHDLKEIVKNLHRKCQRIERVLKMKNRNHDQRVEKALGILSA